MKIKMENVRRVDPHLEKKKRIVELVMAPRKTTTARMRPSEICIWRSIAPCCSWCRCSGVHSRLSHSSHSIFITVSLMAFR